MKKTILKIVGIALIVSIFGNFSFSFAYTDKAPTKKVTSNKKIKSKENFITLQVGSNEYKISYKEGESLYDAMKGFSNKKENKFSFNSKNYPGLGNFIDEINGIKGTPGKYWIYYVNNKKVSVGASKYILKPGDTVTWKQEGI